MLDRCVLVPFQLAILKLDLLVQPHHTRSHGVPAERNAHASKTSTTDRPS